MGVSSLFLHKGIFPVIAFFSIDRGGNAGEKYGFGVCFCLGPAKLTTIFVPYNNEGEKFSSKNSLE